ncbi:precorrin-4 C(11)-methyltransferase [Egibacter rhizosphaerae]|uniref:precorrin-4 C(11)-methyltransferase n=1 Tax=Egibacter rhizosphaerae TaxID=1670831 RepID=UPI00197ABF43|nr:precorrin-4 C(11)-methyltransferase [Egibacter rhizosphaerae]
MTFVGAGPGAPDLLTLRGRDRIAAADVVIYPGSLVPAEVTTHAPPDAEVLDSRAQTLEGLADVYDRARAEGLHVARLASGDPSLYGALVEQLAEVAVRDLDWEVVAGVSSLGAAAAALGAELTVPEVAQSTILTRLATATPMPEGEDVRAFAAHGTTMALFLSAKRSKRLEAELRAGGYPPETPCAVVYRVTWPDEAVHRCRLDELAATLRAGGYVRHTLVLVGDAIGATPGATRSHLYDPGFRHHSRLGPAVRATDPGGSGTG